MATRDRGLPVAFATRSQAGSVCAGSAQGLCMQGGATCLSLGSDPDGQAPVVPPAVHILRAPVGQLLACAGVEPHVVNHSVALQVPPCRERCREQGLSQAVGEAGWVLPLWWAMGQLWVSKELLLPPSSAPSQPLSLNHRIAWVGKDHSV